MKLLSVKQSGKKNIDITTLLIYCQLLIGTPPHPILVWPIRTLRRTPPNPPGTKIVSCVRGCYGEYFASLPLLKWQRKPSTLLKHVRLILTFTVKTAYLWGTLNDD